MADVALRADRVTDGLAHPWDVGVLPDGAFLVTERPGRLVVVDGGATTEVAADLSSVHAGARAG